MKMTYASLIVISMLTFFVSSNSVQAAYFLDGKVSTVGAYMYDVPPRAGATPFAGDADKQYVPFASGALMDAKGDNFGASIGFNNDGDNSYFRVVFIDLGQEVAVESLSVKSKLVAWWAINGFDVSFSTDGKSFTNPISNGGFHCSLPHEEGLSAECKLETKGVKARFVRISLSVNSWRNVQIDEIDIHAKSLEGQTPRTENVGTEALKEIYKLQVEAPLVDEFGQYTREDWPEKIHSEEQLRETLQKEYARYADVKIDLEKFDRFGGSKTLGISSKASGMWRLEKIQGRWWFITPEGNPFIMIAVDGADSTQKVLNSNTMEYPGRPDIAKKYAKIPPKTGRFADCWLDAHTIWPVPEHEGVWQFNFFQANMVRSFGNETYQKKTDELVARRLVAWGFNSYGKWNWRGQIADEPKLPYITLEGGLVDPWSENFAETVENTVKSVHAKYGNDPYFIGITIGNEEWWDADVTKAMLQSSPASPSKKAFIARLEAKYKTIDALNKVCGTELKSFGELADMDMNPMAEKLKGDISSFVEEASRRFYSTWRKAVDKHDPGRLILGSSFVIWWKSSPEWVKGSLPYCDAVMVDDYSLSPDAFIENLVDAIAVPADKPVLIGEYSFTTRQRGFLPYRADLPSQKDRGLYYKSFNEKLFAHPNWVGSMWFLYRDQIPLGRNVDTGGESHNFGLVDICNLPYYDMIDVMKETNAKLYEIHAGQTAPPK